MFGEEELVKSHRNRINAITNIILIAFGFIFARLWYLQIYKGELLHKYALENRLRREVVKAPRGLIYSRDGKLLVDNTPRFDVVIVPQFLTEKKNTLSRLATILSMPLTSIEKILAKNTGPSYKEIVIKKNLTWEEVSKIETENADLPGVSIDTFISREYKDIEAGAHLLGYISEINQQQLPKYRKRDNFDYRLGDFIGQFGLEEELDRDLRGINGTEFVEVDAMGRKRRYINTDNMFQGIEDQPGIPGKNIKLTIDRDVQMAGFDAIGEQVGGAVAIDVKTGEVLAMVSKPSFDPSQFSRGLTPEYWAKLSNDENHPLRDRVIQEHYSPGSTFKLITAISALEEGVIDEKTEIACSGKLAFGSRNYHCWKKEGHGSVNIYKAIRESCNIFFMKTAMKMDIDVIAKYAFGLGLGKKTGIALPREVSGLIPTKEWKKKRLGIEWQLGETLSCAIGQSYVLTSPLQLAVAYTGIANSGKIFRPHLVKEIYPNNGGKAVYQSKPELMTDVKVSPKTFAMVRRGLFEVVNQPGGTAYGRRGKGILMAGKTGTSQVVGAKADKVYNKCENQEYKYRHHGWFVGFAPAHDPKIAVAVIVEHGCHGSSAAGPVAEAMVTAFMQKYEPVLHQQIIEREKNGTIGELMGIASDKTAKQKRKVEEESDE
jgi:penicillin-binding protein 2